MRQTSLGINFFAGIQVSSTKNWLKKQIQWALSTEEIQEITDSSKKSHKVRDEIIQRYVYFTFPLKVAKFQIWKSRSYAFMKIS